MAKYQLPPEILQPLQELLQQDAQPVLDTFINDVQAAGQNLVSKLPAGAQGAAGLAVTLLTSVAAIAAQGELNVILKHNLPSAAPAAAA